MPCRGKSSSMILPECNSYTFQLHLEEISKSVSPGKQAVLIVDQAAWHTSSKLKIPVNITLLPLPPYSPELNPMEQVWLFLKDSLPIESLMITKIYLKPVAPLGTHSSKCRTKLINSALGNGLNYHCSNLFYRMGSGGGGLCSTK